MATPNPFDQFDHLAPQPTMAGSSPAGLLAPGNIDLLHRPVVHNADGTISTVRSMSANFDGREVLLPTVSDDGQILSDDAAIDLYRRTGRNLGSFDTPEHATAYAQSLHDQQANYYGESSAATGANPFDQFDSATGPTYDANGALNLDITGGISESQLRAQQGGNAQGLVNGVAPNDSAFARMITGQPAPEPQVQEGNALTRTLGEFGGRQVLQGAYGLYGSLGGDALDHYVLTPIDRALGTEGTNLQLGTGGKGYRQIASELADQLGMQRPQTPTERVVSDVGEALTGTGLTMGIGAGVNALANLGRTPGAPMVRNRLAELLIAQPGAQAVSAAAGAAAGGSVRESGGGPIFQTLAGLAGGLAPGAATAALPALTGGAVRAQGAIPTLAAGAARRALRGRDVEGVNERIGQFAAAGINPSVGQVGGSRSAQTLESYLAKSPGSAGRMVQLAEQQAQGARQLTDDLSNSIATNGADLTPTQVGTAVQKDIYGPSGFVDRTKTVSDKLYAELERHLPASGRIEVGNTRQAMQALNSSIEGAPALSRFFQNGRIKDFAGALLDDTSGPAAALTRPDVAAKADELRASLRQQADTRKAGIAQEVQQQRQQLMAQAGDLRNRLTDMVESRRQQLYQQADEKRLQLYQEQQRIVADNARRQQLNMTNLERVPSNAEIEAQIPSRQQIDAQLPTSADIEAQLPTQQQIEAQLTPESAYRDSGFGDDYIEQRVQEFLRGQADGRLPYEALQKLRTEVGHEVDGALFRGDGSRSKWKALYAAMSRDMEAAATTPEATRAWQRANNYYKMRQARLEQIAAVVDKNGGPEAAYQAMFNGAKNGATPLKRVMDALHPKARAEVTAAFLQRMGRAVGSKQNASADAFSMETFLTNWGNLSKEARQELFHTARFGSDYVANVDKLARMATTIREGGKAFANPSGSAGQIALGATIGGTASIAGPQLMHGNLAGAAMTIGGALSYTAGNNVLARLMTNPRVVKWLAHHTQRDTGDTLGTLTSIQALRQIGEEEDLPEAEEVADQLDQKYRGAKGIPVRQARR